MGLLCAVLWGVWCVGDGTRAGLAEWTLDLVVLVFIDGSETYQADD